MSVDNIDMRDGIRVKILERDKGPSKSSHFHQIDGEYKVSEETVRNILSHESVCNT